MISIIVFGAGGRAGRKIVTEAQDRGHQVTAVVRDPSKYNALAESGAGVVQGDVTNAEQVRRLSNGHDAAVSAVARLDVPAERFYIEATSALIGGLGTPGPQRLVVVGIGSNLRASDGRLAHDAEGLPEAAKAFSRGHLAGVRLLEAEATDLDWVVLAPPLVYLDEENGGGPIILGDDSIPDPSQTADSFSYPEAAHAVLNEIETPTRHHALVSIARARTHPEVTVSTSCRPA